METINDPFCPMLHSGDSCLTCTALRKQRYALKDEQLVAYQKGRQDASEAIKNLWLGKDMDPQILSAFLKAEDAALGHGGTDA